MLLFFSLLFGCGVRNDYPVEKDEFKVMVHYINSHYQPNDAVVVSNMFNYLSYVYYNKKGYRALLYTPAGPTAFRASPMPMASAPFSTIGRRRPMSISSAIYRKAIAGSGWSAVGISIRTSAVRRRGGSIPAPSRAAVSNRACSWCVERNVIFPIRRYIWPSKLTRG